MWAGGSSFCGTGFGTGGVVLDNGSGGTWLEVAKIIVGCKSKGRRCFVRDKSRMRVALQITFHCFQLKCNHQEK